MKIAILNYATAEVVIETLPKDVDVKSPESVEDYLSKTYNLDEIEYMTGDITLIYK